MIMKMKKNIMKRIIGIAVLIVVFLAIDPFFVQAGTEGQTDPTGYIEVRTISDLYAINQNPSANYILMNDIDMSETKKGGSWDFGQGWDPIENFSGTFDGNGHIISNMCIDGEGEAYNEYYNYEYPDIYLGLFGEVTGDIRNLGLTGVNVELTIDDDDFDDYGFDSAEFYVGTICGYSKGTIECCYSGGTIMIENNSRRSCMLCGGLTGTGFNIENCFSDATIIAMSSHAYNYIGGLCGRDSAKIENSYYAGTIQGNGERSQYDSIYNGEIWGAYGKCKNAYYLDNGASSSYGKALNAIQMQIETVFQGFDFGNVWIIDPNSGYPYPQLLSCMKVKINSAQLSAKPQKKDYLVTDTEIPMNGIYWNVMYENGRQSKIPVTQDMLEYELIPGEQTVKVRFGGYEESFVINVKKEVPQFDIDIDQIKSVGDTVNIAPETNSDGKISYSSDSYGKATVNASGKVVFNQAGEIPVTVSIAETKDFAAVEKTIVFTVNGKIPYIKAKDSYSAKVNGTIKLNAKTNSNGTVTYISNRPDVVEVDENGVVKCKKTGTSTVIIRTALTLLYEPAETSVLITVGKPDEMQTNSLKIYSGQEIRLEDVFEGYEYNLNKAKLEIVKGSKYVTLDKNGLKAVKKGSATVKASYKNYSYVCEITVMKAPKVKAATYDINGMKIKLPKGFFESSEYNLEDNEYKYFGYKGKNSTLVIHVDSSLSDASYLSSEEEAYISKRIVSASEKFITAMKGEIKNIVSESNFSEKNISVSQEKTKKGNYLVLALKQKNGEVLYYNYLVSFSKDNIVTISFTTYDKELSSSAMNYIVNKNKL